jgi:hypothetical protein
MVIGFLGTLIGLERAVALKWPWAYGAPLCAGLAGLGLLVGAPPHAAHLPAVGASGFLLAIFVALHLARPASFLAMLGLGALLWGIGNVLWHLGDPLFQVTPWWVGFLVLTIAGERLELSRLVRLGARAWAAFFAAVGLLVAGLVIGLARFDAGVRLSGAGSLALAFWLLRHDLAWRGFRRGELPRFMTSCLLAGHLWLGIGGLLWLFLGARAGAGPAYDAAIHAFFLGLVFSMIFAHAPIIFPAVLGVSMPFRSEFYAHLAVLHLSLIARVGGDLAAWTPARTWGGFGNALAILLFLVNSARSGWRGRRE